MDALISRPGIFAMNHHPPPPSWVREPDDAADATIEANWLFRLLRERFRSRRSDRAHDYYVMHLADAVNVIALTPDDQVVLVRQFRAGSGRDSLEPPGGLLEPGEDPCEAGARELREETGYAGDPAVSLGWAWSNPSIMSSKLHVIVVNNARLVGEPKPDTGEEVSVELAPARSIPAMIRDGRIDHALSVMGLLWWQADPGSGARIADCRSPMTEDRGGPGHGGFPFDHRPSAVGHFVRVHPRKSYSFDTLITPVGRPGSGRRDTRRTGTQACRGSRRASGPASRGGARTSRSRAPRRTG